MSAANLSRMATRWPRRVSPVRTTASLSGTAWSVSDGILLSDPVCDGEVASVDSWERYRANRRPVGECGAIP
jgi:hypothetical protein